MKQNLWLGQQQTQKLSPQQLQFIKLLSVPAAELEARIQEELQINPALEESGSDDLSLGDAPTPDEGNDDAFGEVDLSGDGDLDGSYDEGDLSADTQLEHAQEREHEQDSRLDEQAQKDDDLQAYAADELDMPDYRTRDTGNGRDDDDDRQDTQPFYQSQTDQLLDQLSLIDLNDTERAIGEYIIGSLSSHGLLSRSIEQISYDLAVTQNVMATEPEIEAVLVKLQAQLEPAGIAARDIRELFVIQLERRDRRQPVVALALEIVRDHFEDFARNHLERLLRRTGATAEELRAAMEYIRSLNPKPGQSGADSLGAAPAVIPDYIIRIVDEEVIVTLGRENTRHRLRVSDQYTRLNKDFTGQMRKLPEGRQRQERRQAVEFLRRNISDAHRFIESINQRNVTLLATMEAIAQHQREFFLTGDWGRLRPMILRDIASVVGLDESTISRVSSEKYAQTPYGTFLLKRFFSEAVSQEAGEDITSHQIKQALTEIIDAEDKRAPLADEELTDRLAERGYRIARRTVAKYRDQMGIPRGQQRRQL